MEAGVFLGDGDGCGVIIEPRLGCGVDFRGDLWDVFANTRDDSDGLIGW